MATRDDDFGLWLIQFDPGRPAPHLFAAAEDAIAAAQAMAPAVAVPWPAAHRPAPDPPTHAPTEASPLPRRDVLNVTWTAGEARTLASLLTGDNYDGWFEYRHKVSTFIPKVTGPKAPFNGTQSSQVRYHHSLGLYYPFTIGGISALAFKSGLHMAYDGPAVPVVDLWRQIVAEVKPKLLITTGTGGGIGSDTKLGDVVISAHVRFESAHHERAAQAQRRPPRHAADSQDVLPEHVAVDDRLDRHLRVDDSTDYYKLQGLGRCCDMGDATLGLAMSELGAAAPKRIAIRNASDPQIPNPDQKISEAHKQSTAIYAKYQCITTAGSVIASWAVAGAELG